MVRVVAPRQRSNSSISAAVFESVVGAIYLDGGYEPARSFVLRHVAESVQQAAGSETGKRTANSRVHAM